MVLFWLLAIAAAGLFIFMLAVPVPVLYEEAGGLLPFDLRPWGYGERYVQKYLNALSEEGIDTYLGLQHQIDLIFPVVLAAAFVVLFRRKLGTAAGLAMTVVAVIGAVADYSENALVTTILTSDVTPGQVMLSSGMTIVKWLADLGCLAMAGWIGFTSWRAPKPKPRKRKAAPAKKGTPAKKPKTGQRA